MFCGYCGKENADDYSFCSKCGKPLKSDVRNKDTHSTSTSIPPSDTHQENPDTKTHKSDIPQSNYISVHWWKDCEWPWQAKSLDDKELLGNYETDLEAAEAVAKFHGISRMYLLAIPFSTESEKEEKRKLLCKEVLEKKNSTHAKPKSSEVASEDYLSSDSSQAYTTPKTSKPSELTTEKQKISKNKIPVSSSNASDAFKEVGMEETSVPSKIGVVIGKVFLSLLAFMIGALLGDIIGHGVLNISPDPKSLTIAFIWVLIFPVWYPSKISLRLVATIVGPIVAFLFWSISLLMPDESVFMVACVRIGAWVIAIIVQLCIMHQGRVLPVVRAI